MVISVSQIGDGEPAQVSPLRNTKKPMFACNIIWGQLQTKYEGPSVEKNICFSIRISWPNQGRSNVPESDSSKDPFVCTSGLVQPSESRKRKPTNGRRNVS